MTKSSRKGIDLYLLIAIILLMVFGLIMINSVSIYEALKNIEDPSQFFISSVVIKQTALVLVALGALWVSIKTPLKAWRTFAPVMYVLGIVLLLLLFSPLGKELNGATGWLDFGSVFPSVQPIEFAKLGIILYLARWLEPKLHELQSFESGFIPFAVIVGLVAVPVILQPDFGGFLVIIPTTVVMFYIAGAKTKHLLVSTLSTFLVFVLAFFMFPHVQSRVNDFFDNTVDPTKRNVSWQIHNSLIAIGSGGLMGRGINKSIQKYGYLPEVQNDTIFAAIAEETGFRGSIALLFLYLFIGWRGLLISDNAPTKFSKFLALGLTFWIIWQAFVNIGVTIKLLPLTGITLPFISSGGSSLIMNAIAMGILLNISQYTSLANEGLINRRRNRRAYNAKSRALSPAYEVK